MIPVIINNIDKTKRAIINFPKLVYRIKFIIENGLKLFLSSKDLFSRKGLLSFTALLLFALKKINCYILFKIYNFQFQ